MNDTLRSPSPASALRTAPNERHTLLTMCCGVRSAAGSAQISAVTIICFGKSCSSGTKPSQACLTRCIGQVRRPDRTHAALVCAHAAADHCPSTHTGYDVQDVARDHGSGSGGGSGGRRAIAIVAADGRCRRRASNDAAGPAARPAVCDGRVWRLVRCLWRLFPDPLCTLPIRNRVACLWCRRKRGRGRST